MPQLEPQARQTGRPAVTVIEPFRCEVHGEGHGAAWLSPHGELDLASSPQLKQTLAEVLARALLIIIDLRQLSFIDSAGLHVIVEADDRARQTGHRLVLIRGPRSIDRLFALASLTDRLRIVDVTPSLGYADACRGDSFTGAKC